MKSILVIFLFIISNSFGQNNKFEKHFPIEKMILGEWFLSKTEIIGLGDNDSTVITSVNRAFDKIEFFKKKVITTNQLSYRMSKIEREFPYEIVCDTLMMANYINLFDYKRKRIIERNQIVYCNFNELVFERYIIDVGLGEIITKTRYYYTRTGKTEVETNPILGKWYYQSKQSFLFTEINDTTSFILYPKRFEDETFRTKSNCEVTFEIACRYSFNCTNNVLGIWSGGIYLIDVENKNIYFNGKEIVVLNYDFFDGNILKLTINQKITKKLSK